MNVAARPTPAGFPTGSGELGRLVLAFDWSATPLGPIESWSECLRTAASIVLLSPVPIVMLWGADGIMIYNDAYSVFAGGRHPDLLGSKVREGWPEVAEFNDNVMKVGLSGGTLAYRDHELTLHRHGRPEQVWMNLDYSPVLDETGTPAGVVAIVVETTERVLAERRERFHARLADGLRELADPLAVKSVAASLVGRYLAAGRVGYGEVEGQGEDTHLLIARDWCADGIDSIAGRFHMPSYAATFMADLAAGRTVVFEDMENDPRLAGLAAWPAHEALQIRAQIIVPLVKAGRLSAVFFVHAPDARGWSAEDVALVGDVAERTWASVERARAETALRDESRTAETLNRTGAALAAELDLTRLVQMVTDAGVDLSGAEFGAFFYNLTNEAGESYMLYTLSGVERAAFEKFPMPRNTEVFAPTFSGSGVVRSDDIRADPRYGRNAPHRGMPRGHLPVRSYLAVPVTSRSGAVIGGLFFGHPRTGRFKERHERLMVGLAGQAAIAIDNAQLFLAAQRELEERRRAEEKLRDLNETLERRVADEVAERVRTEDALRQAQKMEAVGQLTGGIAHDFNNLLTGISGSLELLQSRIRQGRLGEVDRYVGAAQGASKRAAALTQRLLAFSRRQTLDPKPTDVVRLIHGMEELIRRTVGPALEIVVSADAAAWPTLVDPNQLEGALLNLCINARDAMPESGRITIAAANRQLDDREARAHDLPPGEYLSLCVTDTGTGMTPEVVARAFDPFFTTKPLGQGTGLGLSMIYGFVRQTGGQVRIESEPGAGTTVCLYLPRHHGTVAEDAALAERPDAPRAVDGETVLVVDDEPSVRMLVTDVLEDLGYTAIEAADGASGLKILQTNVRVDLLVTDVGLPGSMNGRQVADAARVTRPDLKVLFITGYAETAMLRDGSLDPGMQVMTKPFVMETLADRIREMIEA
ncbi:GAF domain-containing protein [Methylobacterium durans]|uniref:GAF domain-containing protein n=1 Tax=Methylobacterium durans TaxID=2202825 RepID=UPI002AFE8D15|nr:GAF domain-containing protein [Methylobacterium durans]MEA1830879.1 GAF domain-containing protein [Methylobacterium durans]